MLLQLEKKGGNGQALMQSHISNKHNVPIVAKVTHLKQGMEFSNRVTRD